MLKEDTGTVEAHLTPGTCPSGGEVDRAIRIHQTMSASLTYEQRLWRFNNWGVIRLPGDMTARRYTFNQLTDETDFTARCNNCRIYQATSERQKAIDVAERLGEAGQR